MHTCIAGLIREKHPGLRCQRLKTLEMHRRQGVASADTGSRILLHNGADFNCIKARKFIATVPTATINQLYCTLYPGIKVNPFRQRHNITAHAPRGERAMVSAGAVMRISWSLCITNLTGNITLTWALFF